MVRAALVVAHGMGQQVRFHTIEQVVARLVRTVRHEEGAEARSIGEPEVMREALQGSGAETGRYVPFARIRIGRPAGSPAVELDVYEGYWAPHTEGRVRLSDVARFLSSAVRHGLGPAMRGRFDRWMFGGCQELRLKRRSAWAILLVAGVLIGVAALTGLALLIAVAAVVGLDMPWLSGPKHEASWLLLLYLAASGLTLAPLAFAMAYGSWRRRGGSSAEWRPGGSASWRAAAAVSRVGVTLWYGATLVATAAAAYTLVGRLQLAPPGWGGGGPEFAVVAVMAAFGLFVRQRVVEYLGDVAVYITPHVLDRFAEVRSAVKEAVLRPVQHVYTARDEGRPRYEAVLLAGHSLGSVAIYDALNAMLVEDGEGAQLGVLERTRLLLTFGSPLDKTAFFFRQQGDPEVGVREALAATVQPLILEAPYRAVGTGVAWTNVYAPADPISNALSFYDLPGDGNTELGIAPVRNVRDEDALLPLVAHTEYWDNPAVPEQILAALDGMVRAPAQ